MFKKAIHRKLYEYVVEEIGQRIIRGSYLPGETLPNEESLCKEFGVSRGVLREATKVLSQKGLILTRPKIGTQIRQPSEWNLFDADILIWKLKTGDKRKSLKNALEVRRIIESEAAKLAALRAADHELETIRRLYTEMEKALEDEAQFDHEKHTQLDLMFHNAILAACHNELIAQLANTMQQALLTVRQIDRQDIEAQRRELPAHLSILDAIFHHDPEGAYNATQALMDHIWRDIQRNLETTEEK
jgi:DNA-binding FadR family transcriptional regulator